MNNNDPFCDCENDPCTCAADFEAWKAEQEKPIEFPGREQTYEEYLQSEEDYISSLTPAQQRAYHEAESRDMTSRQEFVV